MYIYCRRKAVQARLDAGEKPHFLPDTRRIRESEWKVISACQPIAPMTLPRHIGQNIPPSRQGSFGLAAMSMQLIWEAPKPYES